MGELLYRTMAGRKSTLSAFLALMVVVLLCVFPTSWFLWQARTAWHDAGSLAWLARGAQSSWARSLKIFGAVLAVAFPAGWGIGTLMGCATPLVRRLFSAFYLMLMLMPPFLWAVGVQGLKAWLPFRHQTWVDGFSGHVLASSAFAIPVVSLVTSAMMAEAGRTATEATFLMAGRWEVIRTALRWTWSTALGTAILACLMVTADVGTAQMMGYQGVASDIHSALATSSGFEKAAARAWWCALMWTPAACAGAFLVARAAVRNVAVSAFASRTGRMEASGAWSRLNLLILGLGLVPSTLACAGWFKLLLASAPLPALRDAWLVWNETLPYTWAVISRVAILILSIGLPLGWLIGRHRLAVTTLLMVALVPTALPSSIHALGWLQLRPYTSAGSLGDWEMPLALTMRWLPLVTWLAAVARSRLAEPLMDSMALLPGAPLIRSVRVFAPLGLAAAAGPAVIAACASLGDVSANGLLQRPGHATYTMRLFAVMDNAPEKQVAAMSLLYLAIPALVIIAFAFTKAVVGTRSLFAND